ncbi:hypothetical protein F2P56_011962 [Juglans regia]|uniref:UPF0496 protein At1g20180-like n=2 Tax=Juglans regia TaxID=51240 RepID=A0A2I4GWD6_JUGRE|nr:UPF0496 protein At1g20180-like [Juglans regia]KAF5467740.1 hypothetical protein F2P56_011962 [Juglans regia]
MWAKSRSAASKIKKDGKELRDAHKSLNVNEEYLSALRTKSYGEFFTKAQLVVNQPSFPSCCHHEFSEVLLEPGQETIMTVLDSAILSKIPELKVLMLMYFDISAEASNICSHLLKSINSVQSNYQFIQRALDTFDDYSPDQLKLIISELKAFIILNNPFSNPDKHDFKQINNKYSSLLNHLKTMRKKVARKLKLIKYFKKAFEICITAASGLIAVAAIVLAFHILAALLLAGPALFISFPMKRSKRIKMLSFGFLRSGILSKVREQIDVAAKGTYILNRSLDTVSRLVARLHDEVEHKKSMIQFFLERRDDKFSLQVVKEIKKSDVGFRKQVQELEEHVYLCLVTINRARALFIKEMTS